MATVVALVIRFLITLAIMADFSFSNGSSFSSNTSNCIESEKQTLLMFKQDLIDNTNRLISWVSDAEDCCRWAGVICDNKTGHVLELHLGLSRYRYQGDVDTDYDSYWRSHLKGKINPCLSTLKHLKYLDLSNNEFEGMLPYQLGNLSNLRTLNLGHMALLHVENLQWLSGLSLLKHLDLSWVSFNGASNWLHVVNSLPSLEELSLSRCELCFLPPFPYPKVNNLSLLTVLDLSFNDLRNDQLDFGWVSNLHSLAFLNLESNYFDGHIPDVFRNLSTSLRHVDFSDNHFNSSIPHWIYSLSDLEVLRIGGNLLQGEISCDIGNMTSLNELDLSGNQLEGNLPTSIGSLCNLRSISLRGQKLNQSISHVFEILSRCSAHKLETLDMSGCHLFGAMTDQLGLFKNLTTLTLSYNSISSPIPTSIGQLAHLESVNLQNNSISGPIPTSIGTLENLEEVNLENNLLEGVVSELHFANQTKLRSFIASDNSLLMLKVHPNWVPPFQLYNLGLGSWHIGPSFPSWLLSQKHLESLDISNSNISDRIPPLFWRLSTNIQFLNLSHNHILGQFEYIPKNNTQYYYILDLSFNCFSGPLPLLSIASYHASMDFSNNYFSGSLFHPLCYQENYTMPTETLILSKNLLSGEIPDCWTNWPMLGVLKLDDNRFTGRIPTSMGNLRLLYLNLHKNSLHGEIPLSLKNSTGLLSLNLGENQIKGSIPRWLGRMDLIILNLRSNKLSGNIPDDLCDLRSLQILDLAKNTLSGSIPRCIYNFTVMAERNNGSKIRKYIGYDIFGTYQEAESVIIKGQILEYSSTLDLVRVVDLSSNNLSGEIPPEMTSLQALQSLNLSHNTLSGKIPKNIGAMQSLESLDLSQNQLFGSIPTSMSSMTFLSSLNLSYNNLSGEIPSSTQLQSFSASSYIGNNLRGCPFEDCIERGKKPNSTGNREDRITHAKRFKVKGLYISIALGFIVGFWSIMAPLVISRRWRFTYYGFLEQMWWRLHDFFKV